MPETPKDLDVFLLPHVQMKNVVKAIDKELLCTDFNNAMSFHLLLNQLDEQFRLLKSHEEIEDNHIVGELLPRLPNGAKTTLKNDLHSDSRLSELVILVNDGLHLEQNMDIADRVEFGHRLKAASSNFTTDLIPHMNEEEKVFLPLLLEYFSESELRQLTQRVIALHELNTTDLVHCTDEATLPIQLSPATLSTPGSSCTPNFVSLPPEILLNILSYLSPQELLRLVSLHSKLNAVAFDGSLWHHLHPVRWAHGNRHFYSPIEVDQKECLLHDSIIENDISKDLMSIEGSVNAFIPASSGEDDFGVIVDREAAVLCGVIEHLLPKVGSHVHTLDLAHGKAVSNEVAFRMLRQTPSLHYLDLSHTGVSDFAFRGMLGKGQSMWKLEYIDLSGCSLITDSTLQRVAQSITSSPHQSSVGSKTSVNDSGGGKKGWEEEPIVEPRLKCLVLSGCHLITDVGLRALAVGVGLPMLHYLDLSGLPNITRIGLNDLVKASPRLVPELLFYCDNIPSGPYSDCANGCQNVGSSSRLCCRQPI